MKGKGGGQGWGRANEEKERGERDRERDGERDRESKRRSPSTFRSFVPRRTPLFRPPKERGGAKERGVREGLLPKDESNA